MQVTLDMLLFFSQWLTDTSANDWDVHPYMNLTNRLSKLLLSLPIKQQEIWNHKTNVHNDCYIQLCVYLHWTKEISVEKRKWLKI